MDEVYKKAGYLHNDFKLFHIIESTKKEFEYHYYDFHKILIFFNGNVSYLVEGRQYSLQPNDIVLINAGELHRPVIHDDRPYDRIILYISSDFFLNLKNADYDLSICFEGIKKQESNLIRLSKQSNKKILNVLFELTASIDRNDYAILLYQKVKLIEFLILLNQRMMEKEISYIPAITANPTVLTIIKYINEHITEELSIETIASYMYLNRSYIMHLFKSETGYTIGNYITEKRLFLARQYIAGGCTVTDACYQSGFKNKYHSSPKNSILPINVR